MADMLERLKAALADRYTIERELGSGGMATVYLAEDVKHHRKVAVKILRPELAAVLGAERFLNEIEVTAHLQHPHILPLFDSGEAGGFLYYVMPYVEGESLRVKLGREKQLSVDETIAIAKQVGAALECAHEHGVIHRDIKPENILIHRGEALVADFGIALAVSAAGGTRLTDTGLSLGTPEYMSPEQATGDRELDARSDVYSLGAVLYEMLVGEPPHTGATVQAIIAKLVTDHPRPITELRDTVPVHVSAAVSKALAKLPADRFDTAERFVDALQRPGVLPLGVPAHAGEAGVGAAASPARWPRWAVPILAVWAVVASVLPQVRGGTGQSGVKSVSRWVIQLPPDEQLYNSFWGVPLAISPDGSKLVYVASRLGESRLYLRRTAETRAVEVAGTEGAANPFFSPDGEWVGFFAQGMLKKVASEGGRPMRITDVAGMSLGGTWDANDTIVYSEGDRGLMRVSASGGKPELLQVQPTSVWFVGPTMVANGSALLVTVIADGAPQVGVLATPTAEVRILEELGPAAGPLYTATGHLLYAQPEAGVLRAVPFDEQALVPRGPSVAVHDSIDMQESGLPQHAISKNGVMAYVPSGAAGHRLVWVDRTGRSSFLFPESGLFFRPRLSPDGRRLLVNDWSEGLRGLWLFNLDNGSRQPLIPDAPSGLMSDVAWTPDGTRVTSYYLPRSETRMQGIVEVSLANTRKLDVLLAREDVFPHSWSPDGQVLAFYEIDANPEMHRDIWVLERGGEARPLLETPANERSPVFSPDGYWLAYVSDESGRDEVYVIAYPSLSQKIQISPNGGRVPLWSRDGRELLYRNGDKMLSVSVQLGSEFQYEAPRVLFEAPYWRENVVTGSHDYDVSPDGRRFVMIEQEPATRINVVLNWFEELKEKVGQGHE